MTDNQYPEVIDEVASRVPMMFSAVLALNAHPSNESSSGISSKSGSECADNAVKTTRDEGAPIDPSLLDPALFGQPPAPPAVAPAAMSVVAPARSASETATFRSLPANLNVALAAPGAPGNVVAPSPPAISHCPQPPFIGEHFNTVEDGIEALRGFVNDHGYDLVTARTHYHLRTRVLKHVVLKCVRRAGKRTPEQGSEDCQFQLSVRKRGDIWILTVDHGLGHNHSPDLPGPLSLEDFALPANAAESVADSSSPTAASLRHRYETFVMQGLIKSMLRGGASIGQILAATRIHDPGTVIDADDVENLRQMLRVEMRKLAPRRGGAR